MAVSPPISFFRNLIFSSMNSLGLNCLILLDSPQAAFKLCHGFHGSRKDGCARWRVAQVSYCCCILTLMPERSKNSVINGPRQAPTCLIPTPRECLNQCRLRGSRNCCVEGLN
jgi:hypothetical protein